MNKNRSHPPTPFPFQFGTLLYLTWAGIFKHSMGARNRVGIGLSSRPARLHRLAEYIPWNRFLGPINVQKFKLCLSPCTLYRRHSRGNIVLYYLILWNKLALCEFHTLSIANRDVARICFRLMKFISIYFPSKDRIWPEPVYFAIIFVICLPKIIAECSMHSA